VPPQLVVTGTHSPARPLLYARQVRMKYNPMPDTPTPQAAIERPTGLPAASNEMFGSDVIAEALRDLGIPFIALTPGASYRGLHDSLVNHMGNVAPQMLLCLHEEHAVAIAHGWAKVTGTPLLAAVHSNVGLFHATMAIFNAWCDRMPVIVLGATGPMDAARRRPWIEWIHTAQDQGAIVRPYVKWDAQPSSPAAAREALFRAAWLTRTTPKGPVYINLDVGLQEEPLTAPLPLVDPARCRRSPRPRRNDWWPRHSPCCGRPNARLF
jgi:thiamine pyrophosphate-dependent acetolactate synthase large subunit-like protein